MNAEEREIIRNARAAYRRFLDGCDDGIDREQLHDVYRLVAEAKKGRWNGNST